MSNKPSLASVLLVDDSHYDVVLTKVLLERDKVMMNLISVGDGREAMSYIEQEPPFEDAPLPDLMLLDLNMPDINGFEVLKLMAYKDLLKQIPVIICSGSDSDQDMNTSLSFGAADYLVKPLDYEKLAPVIARLPGLSLSDAEGQHFIYKA
ncbi:response regulator [Agrobacterium sp. ES01]|uniref:response regulator n=1 Tax=Agrobacterium sp. ES01 TaxID=3420714 RepID=UPI003D0E0472